MPFVSLLISNYKIVSIGAGIIAVFFAGWHYHSLYDAYHVQKDEIKAITDLGKGAKNIIEDTQKIHRVLINENCSNTAHSTALGSMLY